MTDSRRPTRPAIMFVDDEALVRRAFARQSRSMGVAVDLAANAAEAMRLAGEREYPVVITDVQMPGEDGLTLIDRLRGLHPNATYVVVTGVPERVPRLDPKTTFISSVVSKPWDREHLFGIIERALNKQWGHEAYARAVDSDSDSD